MNSLDLPDQTTVYFTGPDVNEGIKPAVFYLALAAYESLDTDPYNQPAAYLAQRDCRVFSIDLPYHGKEMASKDAITKWADAFQRGEDPLAPFIEKCASILKQLESMGLLDLAKTGLVGLSRGGLLAPLIASKLPSCGPIIGFAPMTKLGLAHEFTALANDPKVAAYDLLKHLDTLYSLSICSYISNQDTRVDTTSCFSFLHALAKKAIEKGIRSPMIEMVMTPPAGHMGHGTLKPIFEQGAAHLLKKIGGQTQ